MTGRRKDERVVKRLEVEFSSSGVTRRGITSNLSRRGMYVRTSRPFSPGAAISLLVYLPDGTKSSVRGVVRRAQRTLSIALQNGMAVEIGAGDGGYEKFVTTLGNERRGAGAALRATDPVAGAEKTLSGATVVVCPQCGIKNRVPPSKLAAGLKCGKCGSALGTTPRRRHEAETYN